VREVARTDHAALSLRVTDQNAVAVKIGRSALEHLSEVMHARYGRCGGFIVPAGAALVIASSRLHVTIWLGNL